VLLGGRTSLFLVHVWMCMLQSSLMSSTLRLSVYMARAYDST
jgi:hypothetical protein